MRLDDARGRHVRAGDLALRVRCRLVVLPGAAGVVCGAPDELRGAGARAGVAAREHVRRRVLGRLERGGVGSVVRVLAVHRREHGLVHAPPLARVGADQHVLRPIQDGADRAGAVRRVDRHGLAGRERSVAGERGVDVADRARAELGLPGHVGQLGAAAAGAARAARPPRATAAARAAVGDAGAAHAVGAASAGTAARVGRAAAAGDALPGGADRAQAARATARAGVGHALATGRAGAGVAPGAGAAGRAGAVVVHALLGDAVARGGRLTEAAAVAAGATAGAAGVAVAVAAGRGFRLPVVAAADEGDSDETRGRDDEARRQPSELGHGALQGVGVEVGDEVGDDLRHGELLALSGRQICGECHEIHAPPFFRALNLLININRFRALKPKLNE